MCLLVFSCWLSALGFRLSPQICDVSSGIRRVWKASAGLCGGLRRACAYVARSTQLLGGFGTSSLIRWLSDSLGRITYGYYCWCGPPPPPLPRPATTTGVVAASPPQQGL